MKLYLLLALFFTVCFGSVNAENIEIKSLPDRVEIKINKLDFKLDTLPAGAVQIKLTDLSAAPAREITGFALSELTYYIALPSFDKSKLKVKSIKQKYLGTFRLAEYDDAYPEVILSALPQEQKKKFKYDISFINGGSPRGVNLADLRIQPVSYDPLSGDCYIIESAVIEIVFDKPVQLLSVKDASEYEFFQYVTNKPHLQELINRAKQTRKKYSDKLQSNENWYNPNTKYFRIPTRNSGIAKVSFSELLSLDNSLTGKSADNLHLIWKGEEYPFTVIGNSTINGTGGIYFLGKEARGDTTWYDNYDADAVFFLYYDETAKGKALKRFEQPASASSKVLSVDVDRHIEKDKFYFQGYDVNLVGITPHENWYWLQLDPLYRPFPPDYGKNTKFQELFTLYPTEDDEININFRYCGLSDRTIVIIEEVKDTIIPQYHLKMILNGDTIATKKFNEMGYDNISATLPPAKFADGLNNIEILTIADNRDNIGLVGLDYFTVTGKALPIAFQGKFQFACSTGASAEKLELTGLSREDVFGIDNLSGEIAVPDDFITEKGFFASASVNADVKKYASLRFGDSAWHSADSGIHIVYAANSDFNTPIYKFFSTFDTQLDNYLNAIPAGSFVMAAINMESVGANDMVPKFFSDYFLAIGSGTMQTGKINKGEGWCFAALSGNNANILESNGRFSGFISHPNGNSYSASLKLPANKHFDFIINDESSIENVKPSLTSSSDLRNTERQIDGIIVYHNLFSEAVARLKEHREKQGLKVLTVDVDNVYKEFDFGRKSPYAIKNLMKYALRNWAEPAPRFLLLFGDASLDSRKVMDITVSDNFIPVYGAPVSDYWLSYFDSSNGLKPEYHIGRIPANTLEQAHNFVDKLIYYDTIPERPWMKKFFLLSGGHGLGQMETFYNIMQNHSGIIVNPLLCADTTSVRKFDIAVGSESEAGAIRDRINAGAGWMSFLGHASAEVFDVDGWQSSKLNNTGRYGVMMTISCNAAAFAEPRLVFSRNETYIMEKNKGFVAVYGSSAVGFVDIHDYMFERMLESIAYSNHATRYLGQILSHAKNFLYSGDIQQFISMHHVHLLGDPMTRLRIGTEPDLYLLESDLSIKTEKGSSSILETDKNVDIAGIVHNYGYYQGLPVDVALIREYEDRIDTLWLNFQNVCLMDFFQYKLSVFEMPGIHKITLIIDPKKATFESNHTNNRITTTFQVFKTGLLPLDPLSNWDVKSENPVFRVINPLIDDNEYDYEFALYKSSDNNAEPVLLSNKNQIVNTEAYIEWAPQINLDINEYYVLKARLINVTQGGLVSDWLNIPFFASDKYQKGKAKWQQDRAEQFLQNNMTNIKIDTSDKGHRLVLSSYPHRFKLLSNGNYFKGSAPGDAWVTMEVDNNVYVDMGGARGFNVVVLPMEENSTKGKYRNFDTWETDSSSIKMIEFLRDSVSDKEHVLISICGQAFRLPAMIKMDPKNKIKSGSIDSVRAIFREYGSLLEQQMIGPFNHDSLDWGYSFAMIGRKGAEPGSIIEEINLKGDTVLLTGDFKRYKSSGYVTTAAIGPAVKWDNLIVNGSVGDNSSGTVTIFGYNTNPSAPVILGSFDLNQEIDLKEITAPNNPVYLKIRTDLDRNSFFVEPEITSFRCNFQPSPELAVLRKESALLQDTLMRGEETELTLTIQNISPRNSADSSETVISITNLQGEKTESILDVGKLNDTQKTGIIFGINTKDSDKLNFITSEANKTNKNFHELYSFNNKADHNLTVYEDSVKPKIKLKLDNIYVNNYDYTSIQPKVEIELYDNSPLLIDKESKLNVRIWYYQTSQNTREWNFEYFAGQDLKAILSFIPDSFDYGENDIWIYAEDATGNRDTLLTTVIVSLNSFIRDVQVIPNPSADISEISFNYIAASIDGTAIIDIYSIDGRKIRTIRQNTIIGSNSVLWDGTNEGGIPQAPGVYVFRINVESTYFSEPQYGKIVRVR